MNCVFRKNKEWKFGHIVDEQYKLVSYIDKGIVAYIDADEYLTLFDGLSVLPKDTAVYSQWHEEKSGFCELWYLGKVAIDYNPNGTFIIGIGFTQYGKQVVQYVDARNIAIVK